jgi:hypothetical protein
MYEGLKGLEYPGVRLMDTGGDEVDVMTDAIPNRGIKPRNERYFKTQAACDAVAQQLNNKLDQQRTAIIERNRKESQKLDKYR